MRNVWKGLFVGAVTGAAIGLVLDLGQRLGRGAAQLAGAAGNAVREHGPEVGAAVASFAARGVEQVKDADLPGKARDLAMQLADSSVVETARDTVQSAAEFTRHVADSARTKILDLPGADA
ncbi:MAG: hypothetical protein ABI382_11645 [Nakamurella sp.]